MTDINKCCICEEETFAGRYCIECLDKEKPQGIDDLAAAIGVYANAIVEQNRKDLVKSDDNLISIFKNFKQKDNK